MERVRKSFVTLELSDPAEVEHRNAGWEMKWPAKQLEVQATNLTGIGIAQ